MSAILEALKRIEREPQRSNVEFSPQQVDPKRSLEKRLRKQRLKRRSIRVLVVLFVLGGGTWAAIQYRAWRDWTVDRGERLSSLPAETSQERGVGPAPASKSSGDQRSLALSGRRIRRPETARPNLKPEAEPIPSREQVLKSGPREIKQDDKGTAPPTQMKTSPAQFAEESGFKLDALVWSNNPKSRFAVINGQIVRAGETIKGTSVAGIERDHVSLRTGNRTWELRLNVHPGSP